MENCQICLRFDFASNKDHRANRHSDFSMLLLSRRKGHRDGHSAFDIHESSTESLDKFSCFHDPCPALASRGNHRAVLRLRAAESWGTDTEEINAKTLGGGNLSATRFESGAQNLLHSFPINYLWETTLNRMLRMPSKIVMTLFAHSASSTTAAFAGR